jgi:outer membrane protein, heavy metal efflux system
MTGGLGLLVVALLSASTPPQGSPAETVRVDALLADGSQLASWLAAHSRDVLAASARLSQARADLAQTRLLPNPSLGASLNDVTVGVTNPPGLGFRDTAIYGVVVSETVELGKRGPRIRSAGLRLDAGHEAFRDAWSDAIGRARLALGRVAYLRNRQGALEENLAGARRLLDLQGSRLEHGDISGIDYDRLFLDTQILESDVAQNGAEYQAALAACEAAVFAACDSDDVGPRALDSAAEIPEVDPAWEEALLGRPDLREMKLEEESAREDAVLAGHRAIPDPSLSLGFTRDQLTISGDQPRTLLFGITIPLPFFDRGQHDSERARLRADELKQSAAAALARAHADVAGLLERRRVLERSLDDLRDQALPRSKGVLDSTLAAVNQGELSTTDLLLARRTHAELVLKVMDLQFAAFSARNDLRQALGLDADLVRKEEK